MQPAAVFVALLACSGFVTAVTAVDPSATVSGQNSQDSDSSTTIIIAAANGGGGFLLILLVVVAICRCRRKSKPQKLEQAPKDPASDIQVELNTVVTLPAPADSTAVGMTERQTAPAEQDIEPAAEREIVPAVRSNTGTSRRMPCKLPAEALDEPIVRDSGCELSNSSSFSSLNQSVPVSDRSTVYSKPSTIIPRSMTTSGASPYASSGPRALSNNNNSSNNSNNNTGTLTRSSTNPEPRISVSGYADPFSFKPKKKTPGLTSVTESGYAVPGEEPTVYGYANDHPRIVPDIFSFSF
ncbi:hypothetical protein CAOG_007063 [Capsaspora owczarzaki ATCC 30864]|uniref:Uncharacterized protein n=1 Tax=Capsaspora owczarzaki (strain ATCC 30864) TaxID=595528 RepID=A0A0D2X4X0_CAPO3|nr:hypothetical protein CAOG_007063 [Capsaspora owczarzaki ATCC 30864]